MLISPSCPDPLPSAPYGSASNARMGTASITVTSTNTTQGEGISQQLAASQRPVGVAAVAMALCWGHWHTAIWGYPSLHFYVV